MSYIEWKPKGTKPEKPGIYQVKYLIDDSYPFQYWNGNEWEFIADTPEKCFKEHHASLFQEPIWRLYRLPLRVLFYIQTILMEQITNNIKGNNINWDLVNILIDKLIIINREILLKEFENIYGNNQKT